jgi:hypothetical protein
MKSCQISMLRQTARPGKAETVSPASKARERLAGPWGDFIAGNLPRTGWKEGGQTGPLRRNDAVDEYCQTLNGRKQAVDLFR